MPYRNKADQAASAKRHYLRNKQTLIDRAKTYTAKMRTKNKKFIDEYKSEHPCVDCGFSDIRALEFDHILGEKDREISRALLDCWTIERIKREIAKCEVRCANCHRIVTLERSRVSQTERRETHNLLTHSSIL